MVRGLGVAAVLALCALPVRAQVPNWGQWSSGPMEFSLFAAWVLDIDAAGRAGSAMVQCAGDRPYLTITFLRGEAQQMEAPMQIAVDGRPFRLNARYLFHAPEPGWAVELPPDLTEALRSGSGFTAQVAERGPMRFGLAGSAQAIDAALEGCGTGAGHNDFYTDYFSLYLPDANGTMRPAPQPAGGSGAATTATAPPAPALPAADPMGLPVAPVTLAAAWQVACPVGLSIADGAFTSADLDQDGQPDLMVNTAMLHCAGADSLSMAQGMGACGMHNCVLELYLSSLYQPGGWPVPIYNHMGVPPEIVDAGGVLVLRTAVQGGECPIAELCRGEWRWDGSAMAFTALP